MHQRFGRDYICIGYGATFRFPSRAPLGANVHEQLLDLITPFPAWSDSIRHHPWRTVTYLLRDAGARLALRTKLGRVVGRAPAERAAANPLYDLTQWT